ncbi:DinB family protein [Flavobacterium bizetiae]|uniref:DinB family protein n=1 Tax=Flavobacterium bizetiae TaxID=2704140 RepID=UPI0037573396
MKTYCQQNLDEIKMLLTLLVKEQYVHNSSMLSGATIGQHVRHILEFYQSVLNGLDTKSINYDNRKRNLLIETDKDFAIQIIDSINSNLYLDILDEPFVLEGNFCAEEGKQIQIQTTLYRELAYCLEHSIHHQALIKVGLLELNSLSLIDETFGLAPATIRYKKVCAQ